jgi:hypothetical protein
VYRIAIIRKGQPANRQTCNGDGLKDAVYGLLSAENATITDADRLGIDGLLAAARAMADEDGFAALEFCDAKMTIRPHTEVVPA